MVSKLEASLVSEPEKQNWVIEISKMFNDQLQIIDVETPFVSVFHVPETVTTNKPEAYEPQQIGLGPIHHFQPRPYKKMEQKKLAVMGKVLHNNKIKDFELTILNKVRKIVPIVRSCYDMFLKDDDEHLAWIFAIDGLFLLNLFHTYSNQSKPPQINPKKRSVAQDIMMLENQIPFMILKEIEEALHSSSSSSSSGSSSCSVFQMFCMMHSPLKLCSESQGPSSVDHLLDYMYFSIVNNVPPPTPDVSPTISFVSPPPDDDRVESIKEQLEPLEALNLYNRIPYDEIVKVYEQTISILESFCQSAPVIPSASDLHKAGFKFHSLEDNKGIKNICISGKDVYLPTITLNKDSDVILRNLVVYETLTADSNSFPLREFMYLMCVVVISVDDVKRLENVIKGELEADEVVEFFTEMSFSLPAMKMEEESNVKVMINKINKMYNSKLRMKPYLLLKKLAYWLLSGLRVTGRFVGSSWKIVVFLVSIVTVVFLTLQAYCDVYGCNK